MTQDIDRKRIETVADRARRIITDLEHLAVTGATQHERQVDLLREELAEVNRRIANAAEVTLAGVGEVKAILFYAANENFTISELLVVQDKEIQVIDSIHSLLAGVTHLTGEAAIARDEIAAARDCAAKANAERDAAIRAAADNEEARTDGDKEAESDMQAAVDGLVDCIASLNRPSAKLAKLSNPIGALRIVTDVIKNVAMHVLDGAAGEGPRALALSLADVDQIEEQMLAIEAVCEAAGMAATVERVDIPAWLASNLTTRAEKKAKAKNNVVFEDDAGGPWVIMRNADGRRWFFDVIVGRNTAWWDERLSAARQYDTAADAARHKPRGSKVVTLLEAQRLVANDARIAASASLPLGDGDSNG